MNNMKEYIDALKNGKGFDWISNNGWKLNKDELISIVKELEYAIYSECDSFDNKKINNAAAEELSNWYCDEKEND